MRRNTQLAVLLVAGVAPAATAACSHLAAARSPVFGCLAAAAAVAFLGFRWTAYLIPLLEPRHVKANLVGRDINKRGTKAGEKPIPESLGLAPGVVCIVCLALTHMLHTLDAIPRLYAFLGASAASAGDATATATTTASQPHADPWSDDFPAALASITLMLMLGFVDDVLELPWRVKLVMPIVASLPLVAAYSGATAVALPKPLIAMLDLPYTYVELGAVYYVYMVALVIFCTNSINILAGVNGLEAGQTFLVGGAILTHNVLQLARTTELSTNSAALLSAYIMLPLCATTFGLLTANWFPSRVFVGDTFTYFAGMAIAVAGILGHFSETLLIFLLPQVFNFVYSIPQLFGWVHCPRHRLPTYDPKTNLLTATPNWNLLNLMLQLGGPCTELALCVRLLVLQAVTCALGVLAHVALQGAWK